MLKEKQAEQEVKPQTETPFMQEPKLTKDLKLFDRWDSSLFFWQYYRADKHQGLFLCRDKNSEMIETMIYRYAVSILIAVRRKKSEWRQRRFEL